MNRLVTLILMLVIVIPAVSCNQPSGIGYEALAESLRQNGLTVETPEETFRMAGDETRPVFSVKARNMKVNGDRISVLEYSDEAAAEKETEIISPDGFSFTGKGFAAHIDWIAPPHFYRSGRIIVLYVGRNQVIIDLLNSILGPQFAGDM